MKTQLIFSSLALLFGGIANAKNEPLQFSSSADYVTITAHGARMASVPATSREDRIEFELDGAPGEAAKLDVRDATVGRIEMVGGLRARISVQLNGSNRLAEILAGHSRIESIDGGVRILIPRDAKRALPAIAATTSTATSTNTSTSTVAQASAKAPAAPAKSDAIPTMADPPQTIATAEEPGRGRIAILAVILGLCGIAALWAKKRQNAISPSTKSGRTSDPSQINILAERKLGPRAKVMLLGIQDRELLLSVTDRGVRLISKWKNREDDADATDDPILKTNITAHEIAPVEMAPTTPSQIEMTEPGALLNRIAEEKPEAKIERRSISPAIAGLLKLRQKSVPPVDSWGVETDGADGSTPEEDAEWVRELLAATRAGANAGSNGGSL